MIERYIYERHDGKRALFTVREEGLSNILGATHPIRLNENQCLEAFKLAAANYGNETSGPSYQSRFALWRGFMELSQAAKKAARDRKVQGLSDAVPLTPELP